MRKRQSPRIRCKVKSTLEYRGRIYHGHIENISMNGALLRLDETVLARPGDECKLSVYLSEQRAPLKFTAEMVHIGFSMAGMRFLAMDEQGMSNLTQLLDQVAHSYEHATRTIHSLKA